MRGRLCAIPHQELSLPGRSRGLDHRLVIRTGQDRQDIEQGACILGVARYRQAVACSVGELPEEIRRQRTKIGRPNHHLSKIVDRKRAATMGTEVGDLPFIDIHHAGTARQEAAAARA